MSLISSRAVLSDAVWLAWLIKGLEVEDVDAPIEEAAHRALPVGDRIVGAGDGDSVAGASVGRPAGLAVPEFGRGGRAGNALDALEGLHNVIKVGGRCVADFLGLPVGEGVDEAEGIVSHGMTRDTELGLGKAHSNLTPPLMTGSAVPSAYLFQLSAVPIRVSGNIS
jgi:hypothetical protein